MKIKIKLILLSLALICKACSILMEEELTQKQVSIIMPLNEMISSSEVQTFWWLPVEGATEYKIQIVLSGFEQPVKFISDTAIAVTKYEITLDPGRYEWRIRASNSFSSTSYLTYSLTVIPSESGEAINNIQKSSMIHPNFTQKIWRIPLLSHIYITEKLIATNHGFDLFADTSKLHHLRNLYGLPVINYIYDVPISYNRI
jgi:hypothetical protein